jgi:CHAD domain-containing protein
MDMHREIEVKLEARPDVALPDLAGLPGVAAVEPQASVLLEAVYVDTPDLRLARARTTLRRRTGGPDAGWHLKLPVSAQQRLEVHAPLGSPDGGVPAELVASVRARVRAEPLTPVVLVRTRRTAYLLRDAAGRVLAEVADDAVTSGSPEMGDGVVDAWREWEVELVEGDDDLLASAVQLLQAAGGAAPAWPSKLARALGDRLATSGPAGERDREDADSAGAVLSEHLRAQRDALLACDPQVRRDEFDAVHQMRVATRHLRSALSTFSPLLVGDRGELVRAELGWLGEALGLARDAEVARARLAELVAVEPAELVVGPVGRRLEDDRTGAYRAARQEVLEALDSERYFLLLDALDALVDTPPLEAAAGKPAKAALPPLVRRDARRLARAVKAARTAPAGQGRDEHLHEARKAAKRARYAAEAVIPAIGRPAERFAGAAKELQTLLGDHHDSVELRRLLLRVCVEAEADGESGFTYGRLHALEQARAEGLEAQLPAAWARFAARRRQRWLR